MLRSLRSRLILSHVLPLLSIIPIMGILLIYVLENNFLLPSMSRELRGNAETLARLAGNETQIWSDPQKAQQFMAQYAQNDAARVMFISPEGRLLASSDPNDASRISTVIPVNGLDKALQDRVIQTFNYSSVYHTDVIDLLAPVSGPNQQVIGVIRMSYPYTTVFERFLQLRFLITGILLLGLISGTTLGYFLAISIGSPIRQVTQAVYDLASGKSQEQLEVSGAEEIQMLLQAINYLVERLHQLEEARRQLLANLVHELGRPMGALRAALHAIRRGAKDDPQLLDELIQGMETEMILLERLLDDLSQLHDQVLGTLEMKNTEIHLSDWLPEALLSWQAAAAEKGLHWKTKIPANLPPIYADPQRLLQIVGNLLSNAIKYTASHGSITISAGKQDSEIWICFSDTGMGIPYREQEKIPTPFFRGEQGRRIKQGMGLGLSIVKNLVKAHDGRLEIKSAPGLGSDITVYFPVYTPQASGDGLID
jgi:two-component system sensor histidine kinase BaeS